MDLRQFFSTQTWWGKSIGAFFGFLMAGPIGGLFGLLIGNIFDKGLNQHFSQPCWHYRSEKDLNIKTIFRKTLFEVLGHLAKLDGVISEKSILLAKSNMQQLGLSHSEKQAAQEDFRFGKTPKFNLSVELGKLYEATKNNPELLKLFIQIIYTTVQAEGISTKKLYTLNTILRALHFAPIQEQNPFADYFSRFTQQQYSNQSSYSSNQQQYNTATQQSNIDYAFMILKIPPTATKEEAKRAYRKLMSQHHPDKLIAKGMPDYKIKEANAMTQKISKAYEDLLRAKGW